MKKISKRIFSVSLWVLAAFPWALYPCTTLSFLDDKQERSFGKSFDWFAGHGMLLVNKRNMKKEALVLDGSDPLQWVSRYGSVTFNQHARDFPLGGMNEAGLVVEIMVGPTDDILDAPGLKSLTEVQWIQYALDSFSTIPQVIEGMKNIRVARVTTDTHYLVCDKKADCASFEYLNGELVVHSGDQLPYKAFTNSTYENSARFAAQYLESNSQLTVPSGGDSLARFVRAAQAAKNYRSGDSVAYTHKVLDDVAISGRWRIVYRGVREISFRTDALLSAQKNLSMNFDFNCASPSKVFRMTNPATGDITSKFEDYVSADNSWLVTQNPLLPAQLQQVLIAYPETNTLCVE